jgi:hypothetical protein
LFDDCGARARADLQRQDRRLAPGGWLTADRRFLKDWVMGRAIVQRLKWT